VSPSPHKRKKKRMKEFASRLAKGRPAQVSEKEKKRIFSLKKKKSVADFERGSEIHTCTREKQKGGELCIVFISKERKSMT